MVKKKAKVLTRGKGDACCTSKGSCGGCGYFLGFVGAAVYYLINANGFWNGVLGLLKAAVWPATLVFGLLKFIGA